MAKPALQRDAGMTKKFQIRQVVQTRAIQAHPAAVIGLSSVSGTALMLGVKPLAAALSLSTSATLSLVAWLIVALVVFAVTATRERQVEHPLGALTLGADGFLMAERGTRTFVSFRDVTSLKKTRRGVTIDVVDGEVILRASEECVDAIEIALQQFRASPEFAPAALCGQREESVASWRARMRDLRGDYRGGALTQDDLRRVAANPSAPRDQRIGAAMALGSAPPKVRVEIERAFEETVEPALRDELREALWNEDSG